MSSTDLLIRDLPDPSAAQRFIDELAEKQAAQAVKLLKKEGLLSDVLTLASFSPLLAATMLQNPEYIWWLDRKRRDSGVRSTDELLESLARFSLTNSQREPQVLFARFRRRELLRIYLRDIRRLGTIAEITEEISNLADAVLQSALKLAAREMNNRYGQPQETDDKGRMMPARFCVVALGKLGSRELNYSSDIDLLYMYSDEGMTSGSGSRGTVTNREYFVKLAEFTSKLVGGQTGEGAAYRVDLRLRPHGSLGALALSVADMCRYYKTEARPWERQVMIRSRGCAGDIGLFREFYLQIEDLVFSKDVSPDAALANVRLSKEKIDLENVSRRGYDVKLGRGGIREIEFLSQALQLAYGGHDRWLRNPHTLISLSRLADRHHIAESDLAELAAAYEFLRRTEHVLQMENGVQTHLVPEEPEKRAVLARRITFAAGGDFELELKHHTGNVGRIFARIFGETAQNGNPEKHISDVPNAVERTRSHLMASIAKSDVKFAATAANVATLDRLTAISPHFAQLVAANPHLAAALPDIESPFEKPDYGPDMLAAVEKAPDLQRQLSSMRRLRSQWLLQIVVEDIFGKIDIAEAKRLQTELAEACIAAALKVVQSELAKKFRPSAADLGLAVLALGKLGGRGLDYDSDLDLLLVYGGNTGLKSGSTDAEYYARAGELFVTVLSAMTRDGSMYRIDLRLRPYGSKGLSAISRDSFITYIRETAVIWEMLAFVKLRAVGGDLKLGGDVEAETRRIIHQRAGAVPQRELRDETLRVRDALEKKRARVRRSAEIDIKYGAGGMLDIYFAMRYLQLRDNIPDDPDNRTTTFMLQKLSQNGSLDKETYQDLLAGYQFLSALDHNLRLTVGRTTRVPLGNVQALENIASRLALSSASELLENLGVTRINTRDAFERALSTK